MQRLSPLFARQPIFNRDLEVVAYELLFRSKHATDPTEVDGDRASSHVIFYAFGEQNLSDIADTHKLFVNYTRNLLVSHPPLPPDQLVIEVLETIAPDDEVLEGLRRLKSAGYQIALDDFFLDQNTAALLPFADIIKIDVLALSPEQLRDHVAQLKEHDVSLLAEKVETYEMLEQCKQQGFHFFQGFFLSRPQLIEGLTISDSTSAMLTLLSKLVDPTADFDELVRTLSNDAELNEKLLALVNQSSLNLRRPVDSLSHAVAMLGLTQIRHWAMFLLLVRHGNKPRELYLLSLGRARFCEQLAVRLYNRGSGESAFTAGLLSNLDAFTDTPMERLLDQLAFPEPVGAAIRDCSGRLGAVLKIAYQHERGAWDEMDWDLLREKLLNEDDINDIYQSSVRWAQQMLADQE